MTSEANLQSPTQRLAHSIPPVVVDTSVWISWLAPTDSNHSAAKGWFDAHRANGGEMIAPQLVLTEVAAGIRRATASAVDAHAMAHLLANLPLLTLIPLDDALVSKATYTAAELALRAADAFYVATAKELGVPLVTFDKQQLTRSAGYVASFSP